MTRYAPLLIFTLRENEPDLHICIFCFLQKLLRELAHHSLLTNVQQLVSAVRIWIGGRIRLCRQLIDISYSSSRENKTVSYNYERISKRIQQLLICFL